MMASLGGDNSRRKAEVRHVPVLIAEVIDALEASARRGDR